jgi:hypothetical protein
MAIEPKQIKVHQNKLKSYISNLFLCGHSYPPMGNALP